jgi:D-alanyl-D-alanine carboxypeptidase (penicillin-binding protein 5/6)
VYVTKLAFAAGTMPAGLLAGALPVAAPATASSTTSTTALPPPAAAELLLDVDTGRVLYEHDAHTPRPPGSLTKTLTAMIAADWLAPGTEVPVTATAFNAFPDKVGMKPGQKWPLAIVLHALITDSANDAAYALAVEIGGSLAGFAPIMAGAAAQIGMSDHPVLEDPAGLDGTEGFAGGNRISAWDLAIAARDMMADPALAAIAGERTFDFTGPDGIDYHIVSRNIHFLLTYPGAIGVKTGFTDAAGFCDIEEAERDGRHMLAVVLDSTNPDADAASLISNGFALPADRESPSAPALPAVRQPEPLPATPLRPEATLPPRAAPLPAVVEAPLRRRTEGAGTFREEVAAGVLALAALVLVGRRRRSRTGPARHRRRR